MLPSPIYWGCQYIGLLIGARNHDAAYRTTAGNPDLPGFFSKRDGTDAERTGDRPPLRLWRPHHRLSPHSQPCPQGICHGGTEGTEENARDTAASRGGTPDRFL